MDFGSIKKGPLFNSNPATSTTKTGYPSWAPCFRVLVSGVRNPKALQRLWVSEPNVSTVCCPPQAEERRTNQSKRAMRPLQGNSAKIEIAFRIPPANFIVATLHRRDCSLKFDLRTDEIPTTGGHRFFAHFDSPGHCKSMFPGFCFSCWFSAFFRFATSRVAVGR